MKKWLFGGVAVLSCWFLIELTSLGGEFALHRMRGLEYKPILTNRLAIDQRQVLERMVNGEAVYTIFHPAMGWSIKPNGQFRDLYTANNGGFRANREYDLNPPPGRVRLAAFGDSFTHGDDDMNPATWEAQLEAADSTLEVLNFGVPAFGLDQAFMRYRLEGSRYHPDVVLIGFMSENIARHVNVFRPFYAPTARFPMTKPRYVLEHDRLVLRDNPIADLDGYRALIADPARVLPTFGTYDYFFHTAWRQDLIGLLPSVRLYRLARTNIFPEPTAIFQRGFYNESSEAYQVTTHLIDAFVEQVRQDGAQPVVLVFPNFADVARYRKLGTKQYRPLLEYLDRRGHPYIDLMRAFDRPDALASPVHVYVPNHYNAKGNGMVAEYLLQYLKAHGLTEPRAHLARAPHSHE